MRELSVIVACAAVRLSGIIQPMNVAVKSRELVERIARIEAELAELKRDLAALTDDDVDALPRTAADLIGLWNDLGDISLEEIKKYEYKSKLENDPSI